MISKRCVLGLGFLLLPCSVGVAQSVPVLGYVAAKNADPKRLEALRQGLTELGYFEGKNISIDFREAVMDGENYSVIGEPIGQKGDIILATSSGGSVTVDKSTSTVRIVRRAGAQT